MLHALYDKRCLNLRWRRASDQMTAAREGRGCGAPRTEGGRARALPRGELPRAVAPPGRSRSALSSLFPAPLCAALSDLRAWRWRRAPRGPVPSVTARPSVGPRRPPRRSAAPRGRRSRLNAPARTSPRRPRRFRSERPPACAHRRARRPSRPLARLTIETRPGSFPRFPVAPNPAAKNPRYPERGRFAKCVLGYREGRFPRERHGRQERKGRLKGRFK